MKKKRTHLFIKELASATNNSTIYITLARRYLAEEEWGQALISVKEALAIGNIRDKKETYLLLSHIHKKLGQTRLATSYKQKALTSGYVT